jgi:hypothetical protein
MDTNNKCRLKIDTDKAANDLIQWWNDVLFEDGRVLVYDVKTHCGINAEPQDLALWWSLELTTDKFEIRIKQDSHHVKSYWLITLPEPESTL